MKRMTNNIILLSVIALFVASCGTSRKTTSEPSAQKTVEILAVNDMHGTIDNFPRFAFIVDSLRAFYPDILLVSGGDNQTGNPINDQYLPKGRPIIELMNAVKFDLSAVGNHEFDTKVEGFAANRNAAQFDYICSNLKQPDDGGRKIKPYKIKTLPNGAKVAFTSVLDLNPSGIPDTHRDNVAGFSFTNPYETARQYLYLKDSADILVYVNHFGFENDVKLANMFPAGAIDVIIGGHSHTKVDKEQVHNGVLITQAERRLKYATLLRMNILPSGKTERSMQLITVGNDGSKRADIQEMVDKFNDNPVLNEKIAEAAADFRTNEELGCWMADALRATANTDIAVINKGGVRLDQLKAGDITRRNILTIDPFGNQVVKMQLTGHELKAFISNMFLQDEYRLMFPSGMKLKYTVTQNGEKLVDLELFQENGTPLDMEKTYTVATNSYVASVVDFRRKDPGSTLAITTAEGWINVLQKEKIVPSYQDTKRVEVVGD